MVAVGASSLLARPKAGRMPKSRTRGLEKTRIVKVVEFPVEKISAGTYTLSYERYVAPDIAASSWEPRLAWETCPWPGSAMLRTCTIFVFSSIQNVEKLRNAEACKFPRKIQVLRRHSACL
jgi:hypothetical protein